MDAAFILQFLSDLALHNDREWFATQSERYLQSKAQFQEFVGEVLLNLADVRPAFGEVDPAKCVFRIFRDVRFSKNKSPYKTNFGAVIGLGNKNAEDPCGYFQLEPGGKSFVVCGLYQPTTPELHQVRQTIATNAPELRAILKTMKKHYPNGLTGERSVRVRGYGAEHPAWDLLQFKSFVAERRFTDAEVTAKTFPSQLKGALRAMLPLTDWLDIARRDPASPARPASLLTADEKRQLRKDRGR